MPFTLLGQNAVHAGLSGRANMVVSFWNHHLTNMPISLVVSERKKIDPEDTLWNSVITSTGQPSDMGDGATGTSLATRLTGSQKLARFSLLSI